MGQFLFGYGGWVLEIKDVVKEWFDSWDHPLKKEFELCRNGAGNSGIALGGFMVVNTDPRYGNKLFLVYAWEIKGHTKELNAVDKAIFAKLANYLIDVRSHLVKKSWI